LACKVLRKGRSSSGMSSARSARRVVSIKLVSLP
jgi:hypothetical protein